MSHNVFDELIRENPIPTTPVAPPVEPLLARLDDIPLRYPPGERPAGVRQRRGRAILVLLIAMTVGVTVGALTLLHQNRTPTRASRPAHSSVRQLVDILGVLRRPQTPADRALAAQLRNESGDPIRTVVMDVRVGAPDLALARLASVTPWGQKILIAPVMPLSAARISQLAQRYPQLRNLFSQRPPQAVTLGLYGERGSSYASVRDIEHGRETEFRDGPEILGLDGYGPPIRVVVVIPDGVAKVTLFLPRQAYPGAIAYPTTQTITVPVHNNIAAFQTDRYTDQDHWSAIAMTWHGPSGAIVKRLGNFGQLNTVLPDPNPSLGPPTNSPSRQSALVVIPRTGGRATTFTMAFRRPVSGSQRYVFTFTGPHPSAGCYSPAAHSPITRGPDLGIPSTARGQVASFQLPVQTWCPGTYLVNVAIATHNPKPFSTATFTVKH